MVVTFTTFNIEQSKSKCPTLIQPKVLHKDVDVELGSFSNLEVIERATKTISVNNFCEQVANYTNSHIIYTHLHKYVSEIC